MEDKSTLEVNDQSTSTMHQDENLLSQATLSQPTLEEFNLPESEDEMTRLINSMLSCGMTRKDVEINIEKRKKLYTAALKDFNKPQTKKGRPIGSRKNSK